MCILNKSPKSNIIRVLVKGESRTLFIPNSYNQATTGLKEFELPVELLENHNKRRVGGRKINKSSIKLDFGE